MEERLRDLKDFLLQYGLIEAAEQVTRFTQELRLKGNVPVDLPNPLRHEIVMVERLDGKPGAIKLKRETPLNIDAWHEIDRLELDKKTRNALVRSGFSTLDDIRFGLELELLARVNHVGPKGMQAIILKFVQFGFRVP